MKHAALLALASVFVTVACRSPIENRDPVGEPVPSTTGKNLDGEPIRLPEDYAGDAVVLLVGYEQEAQFDADRWAYGLLKAELDVALLGVPTIPGLVPSWISGWIDDGMRSGIPREDWGAVVTVYGDAAKPIELEAAVTRVDEREG